jgi:hypothetical protein
VAFRFGLGDTFGITNECRRSLDAEVDRELGKLAKELLACAEAAKADDEPLLIERLKAMGESVWTLHDALKIRRHFEGNGGNQR